MIRFDMSEYMDRISISKLIGSPPGYIGYEEGGILTEKIRQEPYTLILFDEIEKAHSDIFNLLLQILDEGRLTDSKGSLIDFKNTLIILTSNIGASIIQNALLPDESNLRFDSVISVETHEKMTKEVHKELNKWFKPEFLNRLDDIIIFEPLKKNDVRKIADILINQLIKKVKSLGIHLTVMEDVKNKLSHDGFNPIYGARPLRRAITNSLENSLTNILLNKEFTKGTNLLFSLDNDFRITLTVIGITPSKKNKFTKLEKSEKIVKLERKNLKVNESVEDELPPKLVTPGKSNDQLDKNRRYLVNFINKKI
jgi:ATP-dependent Clp protease ATP-binding subunit ClpC